MGRRGRREGRGMMMRREGRVGRGRERKREREREEERGRRERQRKREAEMAEMERETVRNSNRLGLLL